MVKHNPSPVSVYRIRAGFIRAVCTVIMLRCVHDTEVTPTSRSHSIKPSSVKRRHIHLSFNDRKVSLVRPFYNDILVIEDFGSHIICRFIITRVYLDYFLLTV